MQYILVTNNGTAVTVEGMNPPLDHTMPPKVLVWRAPGALRTARTFVHVGYDVQRPIYREHNFAVCTVVAIPD